MLLSLPVSSPLYHGSSLHKMVLHPVNASSLRSPLRASSESAAQTTSAVPFAFSYLITECGVHPELAASAVKYIQFENRERADVVVGFLRNLGFSSSQISKIIGRNPRLLTRDPEKSFLPRIRFFKANGFSDSDIAIILVRAAEILNSSVEEQLLPNLSFLRSVITPEEKVIHAVKRGPFLLTCNLDSYLIPNIKILRENGVGDSSIMFLLVRCPTVLLGSRHQVSEIVERVKKMGVNPKLMKFGAAIKLMRGMSEETWQRRMDAYKKWGWSEEVTLKAFRNHPWCMALSEQKIMENMDYFVNQIGVDALDLADRPSILGYSLSMRIMPRDNVLRVLHSKGLIKSRFLVGALQIRDELFLQRFVETYKEEAPELLEVFRGEKHPSRLQNENPTETSVNKLTLEVDRGATSS